MADKFLDRNPDYEYRQDKMDRAYRKAWESAPAVFRERAEAMGLKAQVDIMAKTIPLNEELIETSVAPEPLTIDDELDLLIEKFGAGNELMIREIASTLAEPMEREIERNRASMLGRIACYLIKSETRNITAHIHGLLHSIPMLAAIAGFRSLRDSAKAAGCSVTLVMKSRNHWCEVLDLPVPEDGKKKPEDCEKYRQNAMTNHWRHQKLTTESKSTLCKPTPTPTPTKTKTTKRRRLTAAH